MALARHVHDAAPLYGVGVVLQSETRCMDKLTSWFDRGLLPACEDHYQTHGTPLYSSHLLELPVSDSNTAEDIAAIRRAYRERLEAIDMKLNLLEQL